MPHRPTPHPATQRQYSMGGRVGEWAGAAPKMYICAFSKQTLRGFARKCTD
ncbi:hypothetical protein SJA_C1-01620 [Sphingobium indicum UT26S]|uniref:Uncharacterized protein n=1 Tax=Sphingobium indicum (strain DSM 16413 / CCM 7287 / MTCC 6362 / UT26 / NBRC 101211 / UT26S) TaxID=452662 RepID=D4YXB4_SPHIU|nr:hypothetical protein SJA_C1-01620 [Sphingobium indicum UT26S]